MGLVEGVTPPGLSFGIGDRQQGRGHHRHPQGGARDSLCSLEDSIYRAKTVILGNLLTFFKLILRRSSQKFICSSDKRRQLRALTLSRKQLLPEIGRVAFQFSFQDLLRSRGGLGPTLVNNLP